MTTLRLPARLTYPECSRGGQHNGESLSRVCIDSKCPNRTLICTICEETEHRGHTTLPVRLYLEKLAQQRQNLETDSSRYLHVAEMQRLRIACLTAIESKRREVSDRLQEVQGKIVSFFDNLDNTCRGILYTRGPSQNLLDRFMYDGEATSDKIVENFKEVLEIFHNDSSGKPIDVGKQIQNLLESATEKQKKLSTVLINLNTDMNKHLDLLNACFETSNYSPEKIAKYVWSETLKAVRIKIIDLVAQQTGSDSSGQRFILMEPSLFDINGRKKQWAVKVKKFGGWVGIGISLQKVIQNANFHFNYTVTGHGSYLISSNGYSWSHSVKEFNSAFKTFTFTVNDIVYLEYDPQAGKLRFQKNESKETKDRFEMDVVAPPPGDAYHPSANLCNPNDSVEIIHTTKPLT